MSIKDIHSIVLSKNFNINKRGAILYLRKQLKY